jgi:hypothetical protein
MDYESIASFFVPLDLAKSLHKDVEEANKIIHGEKKASLEELNRLQRKIAIESSFLFISLLLSAKGTKEGMNIIKSVSKKFGKRKIMSMLRTAIGREVKEYELNEPKLLLTELLAAISENAEPIITHIAKRKINKAALTTSRNIIEVAMRINDEVKNMNQNINKMGGTDIKLFADLIAKYKNIVSDSIKQRKNPMDVILRIINDITNEKDSNKKLCKINAYLVAFASHKKLDDLYLLSLRIAAMDASLHSRTYLYEQLYNIAKEYLNEQKNRNKIKDLKREKEKEIAMA